MIFSSAASKVSRSTHLKPCEKGGVRGITCGKEEHECENGHLIDTLSYELLEQQEKTLPSPALTHSRLAEHMAAKTTSDAWSSASQRGHKQTEQSRWPSLMICPNRLRVLAVSGSQILRVNTSGDWSTFNLNDLHAAAASPWGNSNASITLHSLPNSIQEGLSNQIN